MNKKLLALAIGAAIAMPVAALAEGPTLYGKIDLSLENQDTGAADMWVVQNNASRLGVKGSADTGVSGLQGIYLAEFGVDADDGASPFTGRNIYAGLKGDFGTVLIGTSIRRSSRPRAKLTSSTTPRRTWPSTLAANCAPRTLSPIQRRSLPMP